VLALLCAGAALLRAEPLPAAAPTPLAELRAAGSGSYTWWGFTVYEASLWVAPGFDAADLARQRYVLELKYARAFKGSDIAQRSLDEMRRIGTFSEAQGQRWLQAMQRAFPDVRPGDRLLGVHEPGRGAQFYANGRPTAEIADARFAELFFGIWLSEQTSAPQLRLALLGPALAGSGR
jgi:hypothetical protein